MTSKTPISKNTDHGFKLSKEATKNQDTEYETVYFLESKLKKTLPLLLLEFAAMIPMNHVILPEASLLAAYLRFRCI